MKNDTDHRVQNSSYHSLLLQYVAVFTGILISACFGMHVGWPSPSLPLLLDQNSTIPTTNSDGSWIVSIPFLVEPVGCVIGALIVNRIGRKPCILLGSPLLFTAWIIVAYAYSVFTLGCGRALAGIGGGIVYIAIPMYVGEIADKRIRGLLACSVQVASKLGIFAINIIGLQYDIRLTALIATSVPILHFVTFIWMPESPHYFLLRKRNQKAASSLKKFNKTINVDTEISELSSMIIPNSAQPIRFVDILTKKVYIKALGIILGLKMLQHFSGYYAITFYCLMIFNEAGGAVKASTATAIYFIVQLISCTLACVLVDKAGRKPLLIISVTGAGVSLLVEGVYFYLKYKTSVDITNLSFLPLAALLVYTFTYSIGLASIPLLILSEIFPANIKAFAVGFGITTFGILTAVVSKIFQIVKDEYGIHIAFFIFAACCIIGFIFIVYCVPETKGKSLEQIQLEWIHSNSNINKQSNHQNTIRNT